MPTNSQVNSSIVAGTVPPDQCWRSPQEIVDGVAAYSSIQNATPESSGSGPSDSIAQQALNTANTALATANAVQAAQKEFRAINPQSVPDGDSSFVVTFPEMPSVDYNISLTFYAGADAHPAAYYAARVLSSSITTTGFTVLVDNAPANTLIGVGVIQR